MLSPALTDWLGYVAASLTTLSFVPQAWLTFRTRNVAGISLGMYSVFTVGVALWLGYGIVLGAWPVIVANAVTLALAIVILGLRIVLGGRGVGSGR
jgi:MtN3 and saliva related transmembrane protein